VELDNRMCNVTIKSCGIPEAETKAQQIFNAVQGVEIDRAIVLLEWCSRYLLRQKSEITPALLQAFLEQS